MGIVQHDEDILADSPVLKLGKKSVMKACKNHGWWLTLTEYRGLDNVSMAEPVVRSQAAN